MAGATIYKAAAIRDAYGLDASPGAVAFRDGRVVGAGLADDVAKSLGSDAATVDLGDRLLLPGLVNAHAHLDLTDVGRIAYGGDFIAWVRRVMAVSRTAPYDRGAAAQRGAAMSWAAGVLTVGDIAGHPDATAAFCESELRGVSYIEQFGIGIDFLGADEIAQQLERWEDAEESGKVRIGLQPHAPYSAGPELYQLAVRFHRDYGTPICTHLAETEAELRFVAEGTGPFRELLESMGKWKPAYVGLYNEHLHPVNWLLRTDQLDEPRDDRPHWLLAHCNYVGDEQIERLTLFDASVAYCPRASDYFAHYDHRYRDMLDAGVNVALGTDSIVCHGTLSIVDEMRHLHRRDRTDALTLLEMATVNGMRALGLDERDATFAEGAAPGLIALRVDPADATDAMTQVLASDHPPEIEVIEGVAHARV